MTESRRNLAVGITVLLALSGLGFMILLFGEAPTFFRPGYTIYIDFPGSGGASAGSDLHLHGLAIGKIKEVSFKRNEQGEPDARLGVVFVCHINEGVKIPGQVNGYIYSRGVIGGSFVEMKADGRPPGNKRTWEWLPPGASIQGMQEGSQLVPPELMEKFDAVAKGFQSLGELAGNINRLIGQPEETTQPTTTATAPAEGLSGTLARINRALDDIHAIAGSPENQENLRDALKSFRQASQQGVETMTYVRKLAEDAGRTVDGVDDLTARLIEQADALGKLLTTLDQAAAKISDGEGSAGKFLNDPRLYNNLLAASEQLNRTLTELQTTIRNWQQQGVPLKLK